MILQLVVWTHLKHISQIGSFPRVGMKIKHVWNHHLVELYQEFRLQTHWHKTIRTSPVTLPKVFNLLPPPKKKKHGSQKHWIICEMFLLLHGSIFRFQPFVFHGPLYGSMASWLGMMKDWGVSTSRKHVKKLVENLRKFSSLSYTYTHFRN